MVKIIQDTESFAKLARELSQSTIVLHVSPAEVLAYKNSNPFFNSVSVHGIFRTYVMKLDGKNLSLWSNSGYHQSGSKTCIEKPSSSKQPASNPETTFGDASISANDSKIINEKTILSYQVMKVAKSNYLGYYTIITELCDLSKFRSDDEVEINYLKKSHGKWVIVENDTDLRMVGDLHTCKCSS